MAPGGRRCRGAPPPTRPWRRCGPAPVLGPPPGRSGTHREVKYRRRGRKSRRLAVGAKTPATACGDSRGDGPCQVVAMPSTATPPENGRASPAMQRSSVVLPAPLAPTRAVMVPASMAETSWEHVLRIETQGMWIAGSRWGFPGDSWLIRYPGNRATISDLQAVSSRVWNCELRLRSGAGPSAWRFALPVEGGRALRVSGWVVAVYWRSF